jgi:membrane protein YqaA with SNARE-associated domain
LLFPTDLTSFLDLIRQHGDAAYSIMFAYAASHSLLLALFAGYAAHSGALGFGTLIVVCWFGSFSGDVIRFWIGRRFGTRWIGPFPRLERAVQTAAQLANRHYVWMILFHRYPHGIRGVAGFAYGMSRLPWSTFLVLNFIAAGLCLRSVVGEGHERCLFGSGTGDAGRVPRSLLVFEQKTRACRRAKLKGVNALLRRAIAPLNYPGTRAHAPVCGPAMRHTGG